MLRSKTFASLFIPSGTRYTGSQESIDGVGVSKTSHVLQAMTKAAEDLGENTIH